MRHARGGGGEKERRGEFISKRDTFLHRVWELKKPCLGTVRTGTNDIASILGREHYSYYDDERRGKLLLPAFRTHIADFFWGVILN